jgi:hypothetical protein
MAEQALHGKSGRNALVLQVCGEGVALKVGREGDHLDAALSVSTTWHRHMHSFANTPVTLPTVLTETT